MIAQDQQSEVNSIKYFEKAKATEPKWTKSTLNLHDIFLKPKRGALIPRSIESIFLTLFETNKPTRQGENIDGHPIA